MIPQDIVITGLGVYLPDVVDISWAIEQGYFDAAEAERTGLLGAAVAGERISAPEMGLAAARQALERSAVDPANVELLLYADAFRAGPEGWLPQFYLQRHLIGGQPLATGIRQECNGMLCALELGASYLQAVPERTAALLVAADNFTSPDLDRWRCALPNFVLADGASAITLGRGDGFARVASVGSLTLPEFEGMHRGDQPLVPAGHEVDFQQRLAEFIASGVDQELWLSYLTVPPKLVHQLLDEAGIGLSDVSMVFFFNTSRDFVETAFLNLIDFPLSRTTWDFGRRIGHVGASDHVISLDHVLRTGRVAPGDRILLFGTAPGMNLAGAVLEITDIPAWAR